MFFFVWMDSDEMFARQLATLCDVCMQRPSNDGYDLCQQCYEDKFTEVQIPREDATYEELMDFCERQNRKARKVVHVSLPTTDAVEEDTKFECPICLDKYSMGDKIMTSECIHRFHEKCLTLWVKEKASCPVCIMDISVL